jgi:hypothetical protein
MADYYKFTQLLRAHDYTVVEYFVHNKYCLVAKVLHEPSGRIYFLSIARSFKLALPEDVVNQYVLVKEDVHNREFSSQQLTESYPLIRLDASGDEVVDNIADKLQSGYRQPISIQAQNAIEYVNQMKRLKYCFKTLEYKMVLHNDQHLVLLTADNGIEVYKVENYPRTDLHTFYVLVTLEQLYARLNVMHDTVEQIEREFYGILDLNQERHNQFLHTTHVEYFIRNNARLLGTKRQLHDTYQEICTLLGQVQRKETTCAEKLRAIQRRTDSNLHREAEHVRQREELERNYQDIHSTKLQVLDKLLKLDRKMKNMYLVMDDLGFNLSVSFNELRNELYKMLL